MNKWLNKTNDSNYKNSVELARWAVSAIFENDPSGFHRIFLLFDKRKYGVFQIFLLRSIKAYFVSKYY